MATNRQPPLKARTRNNGSGAGNEGAAMKETAGNGGVAAATTKEAARKERPARQRQTKQQPGADSVQFWGSQVGGEAVINYSYTDPPFHLLMYDMMNFFVYLYALPWILWPVRPCPSGAFDELSFTRQNVFCIFMHCVLLVLQLGFFLALPLLFLVPVWAAAAGLAAFFALNYLLARTLNGSRLTYNSDPQYAEARPEHAHEKWFFLNGVACGETWLMGNINRLALTFKRPVTGIHNRTSGILFDVVECLVQRNFGYATTDVREAYRVVKATLYKAEYTKVVFVLHSQGGIEGGMVLDWLLQELPQDLLAKLEVYTFGCAANHFNNPHRHAVSQHAERKHEHNATSNSVTQMPLTDSPTELKQSQLKQAGEANNNGTTTTKTTKPSAADRAIGHIEHYAHTTDFVALWGVLHFVTNAPASPTLPRFIGRVFSRTSSRGGHQLCQHYLDGMFPLARADPADPDSPFAGCAETGNAFMESSAEHATAGDAEREDAAEEWENSWDMMVMKKQQGGGGGGGGGSMHDVAVHGSFDEKAAARDGKLRVKDLSRLWLYRNGKSPPDGHKSGASGTT